MKLGVINVFTTSTTHQTTAFLHYKTTSWGKPRNPSTWQTSENVVFKVTARGYTLHEHIALFDIINMNGRLYDAKLGRMLSPDNYIQAPTSTQSYNRYSYAFNNPLKYVDPDGNWAQSGWSAQTQYAAGGSSMGSSGFHSLWGRMTNPHSFDTDAYKMMQYRDGVGGVDALPSELAIQSGTLGFQISLDNYYTALANPYNDAMRREHAKRNAFKYNYTETSQYEYEVIKEYVNWADSRDILVGVTFKKKGKHAVFDDVTSPQGQGDNFSLASLYTHFQFGGGEAMTFNMSSVNFGGATQRDLRLTGMKVNDIRRVNLFNAGPLNQAALAFGRVRMQYHGNDQFSIVGDKSSEFNFSPLIDFNASMARNAGNVLGAAINYNLMISPAAALVPLIFGGPFPVYFNGTTTIPQ